MKIVVVGATGVIGSAVCLELSKRHQVIQVGHVSCDLQCDIKDENSIRQLFEEIKEFDALISTTGKVHFGPYEAMTNALYQVGLQDKLMGQINLVLIGKEYVRDNGSFTLTSGVLSHDPIRFGTSASMVNGAIDSFAMAASIEMKRGLRINVVSPGVVLESITKYESYFRGFKPVSAFDVALAYCKSVEGAQTGKVYTV